MVVPVYEETEEGREEPYSWHWLSTISRVNAQVMKVSLRCASHSIHSADRSRGGVDACARVRDDTVAEAG
jgi:hypothetical protein